MSKSNKTTPNVPTLRFAEFAEQWEQKTFDETFSILSNNTLSRAELNYENGNYKNIHYGDVLIKFSAFIDALSPDVPYINDENSSSKLDNILLQDGDIIIADTAEDFTVGKATEVENVDEIKVVSGLHTIPCRPKIKFSPRYLGYYVNSPAYHNQLIPFIQGVKVSSISKTLIKKTFVSFPSLSEQTKIADFLSCLDKKIEVQNKIISDLKVLKKELCNKVFGKGSAVRLGDFIEEVTTRNKSNSCENVLSVSNKMGFIKQSEQFEDRTVASENKSNYKVVTEGCFAYNPARINVGSIALLSTYKIGIISPMYVCFKTKSNLNSEYLNFYYQSGFFYKELQKKLEGSVRQCLTYENMSEILIPYVGIEEQKAIAVTLNKFATLIATEEKYIKSLQKQKSYFLNAMFI